jgi:hypothetical protein
VITCDSHRRPRRRQHSQAPTEGAAVGRRGRGLRAAGEMMDELEGLKGGGCWTGCRGRVGAEGRRGVGGLVGVLHERPQHRPRGSGTVGNAPAQRGAIPPRRPNGGRAGGLQCGWGRGIAGRRGRRWGPGAGACGGRQSALRRTRGRGSPGRCCRGDRMVLSRTPRGAAGPRRGRGRSTGSGRWGAPPGRKGGGRGARRPRWWAVPLGVKAPRRRGTAGAS